MAQSYICWRMCIRLSRPRLSEKLWWQKSRCASLLTQRWKNISRRKGCTVASRQSSAQGRLVFVQIFAGDIILRYFVGVDFAFVSGVFHSLHDTCLERISFFDELVHTFRICTFTVGQSLQVTRLAAGRRSQTLASEGCRVHDL